MPSKTPSVLYIFRDAAFRYVYLDWLDGQRRFFVGTPGNMVQAEIKNYDEVQVGQSWSINTYVTLADKRVLYIPSVAYSNAVPSFDGKGLLKLDSMDRALIASLKIPVPPAGSNPPPAPRP